MSDQAQNANPPIELGANINVDEIKKRFAETGRAQVKNVLADQAAERFFTCLSKDISWSLAYNDGNEALSLTAAQMGQLQGQDRMRLHNEIFDRATRQFQYAYSDYPVAKTLNDPNSPNLYVHDVLRFVNSEPFLALIREITGLEGRLSADGHATCFQSGHFLTIHDDVDNDDKRAIAYVFNMTKDWRPDWGAALQFFDDELNIVETFAPTFNALNIFRVPQIHTVSFVPPYAQGRRYGMTGWFHRAG